MTLEVKKMTVAIDPTPEDTTDLIEEILEKPEVVVGHDSEACYLAAIEREDKWDVWSYCEDADSLCYEGTFDSVSEAKDHAQNRADEIRESVEESLADAEDAEWEARATQKTKALTAPFTFSDNTGHPDGIELEDEEDLFAFFRRDRTLIHPEEWGNLYSCWLTDANGTHCWVTRSRRGELRLESEE